MTPILNFRKGDLVLNEKGDLFRVLPNRENVEFITKSPLTAEFDILGLSPRQFELFIKWLNYDLWKSGNEYIRLAVPRLEKIS